MSSPHDVFMTRDSTSSMDMGGCFDEVHLPQSFIQLFEESRVHRSVLLPVTWDFEEQPKVVFKAMANYG